MGKSILNFFRFVFFVLFFCSISSKAQANAQQGMTPQMMQQMMQMFLQSQQNAEMKCGSTQYVEDDDEGGGYPDVGESDLELNIQPATCAFVSANNWKGLQPILYASLNFAYAEDSFSDIPSLDDEDLDFDVSKLELSFDDVEVDADGNGINFVGIDNVDSDSDTVGTKKQDGQRKPSATKPSGGGEDTCEPKQNVQETCKVTGGAGAAAEVERVLEEMERLSQQVKNAGVEDCKCCLQPSVCLMGGFGKVLDVLRVGNWAGLLASSKFANLCKHVKNTQMASAGMDGAAAAKCGMKSAKCSRTHNKLIERFEETRNNLEVFIEGTFNEQGACTITKVDGKDRGWFDERKKRMGELINKVNNSKGQACTEIKGASIAVAAQAAATTAAAAISKKCQENEENNHACDNKTGEELDKCCEKNRSADACEGRNTGHPCHPLNISKDPQRCQEECRRSPSHPFCKNFCLAYWTEPLCSEQVCQHFSMSKCGRINDPNCVSSGCAACKSSGYRDEACNQWCQENPDHPQCTCPSNPKMCRCDNPSQADYVPGGCGISDGKSIDCSRDPSAEGCTALDRTELSSEDLAAVDDSAESPFLPPNPFAAGNPDKKAPASGGFKYSSPGSAGAPGVGGGSGGGSGGGGSDEGGGEGEGGEGASPYDDLLAGLTKSKGGGGSLSGYSNPSKRRGSANKKGKGFDLRKFLPKKKKKKAKAGADRKPASPEDSIFDVSSQITSVFCSKNQVDCINNN